ncbi:MAG: hypothetical protein JXA24_06050 [Proteobacteria bacterium]|nr:hypothetical protein [Pseudomonadota bacterium]
MMRIFHGAVVAAIVIIVMGTAVAHEPNAVDGYYDLGRGELLVTVQHLVNDPKGHFIKEVVVYKDGKEAARKDFSFQTSHRNQTMPPFKIPAQVGDSFRVVARCSVSGEAEATIEVVDRRPDVRKLN